MQGAESAPSKLRTIKKSPVRLGLKILYIMIDFFFFLGGGVS